MPISDSLDELRVADVDLSRYVSVSPAETVTATIEAMRDTGFSCACVVDGGELMGVFTQRDVLMRVLGRPRVCDLPIAEEMTRGPRTMRDDQSVADGLGIMREWWVRSVPVLDEQGTFTGNLSWYTVMRTIARLLNLPADESQREPGVEHGLAFVDFTGLNTSTPVMVSDADSVEVAVHHMQARAIGSVLVVDQREQLVGIVTEFDLLTRLACTGDDLADVSVGQVMTSDVVALSARSSIADAIEKMAERGFSHAPLLGESSRPVGIASFRDVAAYFESSLESLG
ncbi:MAG: CBS domain-containing protein [Acidimicrobiia bacterium]